MEISKEQLMQHLQITQQQIDAPTYYAIIIEKLFCMVIIRQGTIIAEKILADYNKIRDILFDKEKT